MSNTPHPVFDQIPSNPFIHPSTSFLNYRLNLASPTRLNLSSSPILDTNPSNPFMDGNNPFLAPPPEVTLLTRVKHWILSNIGTQPGPSDDHTNMATRRSARLSVGSTYALGPANHDSSTEGSAQMRLEANSDLASEPLLPPLPRRKRRRRSTTAIIKIEPGFDEAAVTREAEDARSSAAVSRKKRKTNKASRADQVKLERSAGNAIKKEMPIITAAIMKDIKASPSHQTLSGDEPLQLSPVRGKGKGAVKKETETGEKRLAIFRQKCPKNIMDRVTRVMSQRMFMVDREKVEGTDIIEVFRVLGSTGNVYTVTISQQPRCDCPDCTKGNVPCKHILFVFLKVLKVPQYAHTWYQKALLTGELRDIFNAAPDAGGGSEFTSTKIRNSYLRATGKGGEEETSVKEPAEGAVPPGGKRISAIGEDCPVCFEEMSEKDDQSGKLIYDETLAGCGKPLHKECFNMWAATATKKGDTVTCVWCRTPWPSAGGSGKGKGKAPGGAEYSSLGYLNMADLVGMSRERDTSSYYWGPMAGRRWNESRYDDD